MTTKQLYTKRNQQIKQMWFDGFTRQAIATTWGISRKQVRKIVNRKQER